MVKLDDYITSSGKYPERANSPELTKAVILYATELLERVNKALKHLNLADVKVSSGFRPSKVNSSVGGSKMSAHTIGQAIDLEDRDQAISKAFTSDVLTMFDLYREDNDYTPTWAHLQIRPTRSGKRIFRP